MISETLWEDIEAKIGDFESIDVEVIRLTDLREILEKYFEKDVNY